MRNKSRGFTLIELLLVIALMAISVGITSDILVTIIRSYNKSQVINEIEQNANFVSQKLTKELRNASRVDSPVYPNASNTLQFLTKSGVTIRYRVNSSSDFAVSRDPGNGTYSARTQNISPGGVKVDCVSANACFKIIQDNPQVVKISIKMEQPGTPGTPIFTDIITIEDTIVIRDTY